MSLIELMISLALGIILVSFSVPTFIGSLEIYNTSKAVARTDTGARFALSILSKNIRNAGFRGCDSGAVSVTNKTGDAQYAFTSRIFGQENVTSSQTISDTVTTRTLTLKNTSDTITLASLNSSNAFLSTSNTASSNQITLNNAGDFNANDIVFLGDCESAVMLKISSLTGNTITLNSTPDIKFTAGTYIYKHELTTYFISPSQLYVNNAGQTPNALWRKINTNDSEELIVGIEDLQLSYRIESETVALGTLNQIVTATSVSDSQTVNMIRFEIKATSLNPVGNDGVLEKTFSKSINLRNG